MDEIDKANDHAQLLMDSAVENHLRDAPEMAKGEPGECEYCGHNSPRLVGGACAPCRDEYGLP
jgi:hypothetical protein